MSMIPQAAMAVASNPQFQAGVANAAGQMAGQMLGTAAGRVAGAGLNTGNTYDTAKQWIKSLDPTEQARLQNELSREQAQDAMRNQMQGTAFAAGLGNTAANLTTERQMALNAQQNQANNVANQLQILRDRSAQNAQAITAAMQTGAAMFR